jgi:AAA15 family ATPase/GTPase
MLIQFNFENFKSFFHEASLDMTATSLKEHPYNLIEIENTKSKEDYIKVAAIYGANASGKSSVIDAFEFMQVFVRNSFKMASALKLIPFKSFAFSDEKKDSTFEVFFRTNNNEYQYGFKINKRRVVEEWLYKRDFRSKYKFRTIFERHGEDFSIPDLKSAENFTDMVEGNTLFLSILSNAKIPVVKEVFDWFTETTIIDFGDASFEHMLTWTLPQDIEEPAFLLEIVQFLNAIGAPIDDFAFEKFIEDDMERYKLFSIYHHNGQKVRLPFYEESSGTIKMFTLFLHMKTVLLNGAVIFIDELDAKLHPLLLRYVITMFHDEKTNPNNAQLIYTTHDNYTLTKDVFRRDQIWFVEKQSDLTAELYSLAEYKLDDDKKVRNDASYNKDYLLGKYGGVPVLKEFDMWSSIYEKE